MEKRCFFCAGLQDDYTIDDMQGRGHVTLQQWCLKREVALYVFSGSANYLDVALRDYSFLD